MVELADALPASTGLTQIAIATKKTEQLATAIETGACASAGSNPTDRSKDPEGKPTRKSLASRAYCVENTDTPGLENSADAPPACGTKTR